MSKFSSLVVPLLGFSLYSASAAADFSVEVTIDPAQRSAISPYVYGTNQDLSGVAFTARRQGGNRMTGYNWENNASNAGSDYFHQSDNYLTWVSGISDADAATPGIVVTKFHDASLASNVPYSLVTLQLAGYVAKDKSGPVSTGETAPSARWLEVKNTKGSAFSTTPNTTDVAVYLDEFVNFLVQKYGSASTSRGIRGYSLDNEPSLWPSTHVRIHPAATTVKEIVAKGVDTAQMVKRIDSSAEVFGPALYGVNAYVSFQAAPDWNAAKTAGNYTWFLDYYLAEMKKAGATAGKRLLDVLDLHLYSEQRGGNERVTDSTNFNNIDCNKARLQAPRSLYDPTYLENSWVGENIPWTMPFITKAKASISSYYPDTKLSFTEYNFGGEGHISGGIAQADTLGAFGANGVYLASWWQLKEDVKYIRAAFNLYLNYDGAGGRYGDTALATTSSNVPNCVAYASVDANDDSRLHVILLNRNYDDAANVTLRLGSARHYASARVWGFDASSANLTERAGIPAISGNQLTYRIPALTAVHLVIQGDNAAIAPTIVSGPSSTTAIIGLSASFTVNATGTPPLTYKWYHDDFQVPGTSNTLTLGSVSRGNQGSYRVVVSNAAGSVTSSPATLTVLANTEASIRLKNLSTRAFVGTGERVLIAGLVIRGPGTKKVLLRAVGPTLSALGVNGALADPKLTLYSDSTVLATNDNWDATDAEVSLANQNTGSVLPAGSKDSALVAKLTEGNYTAIVTGVNDTTGVALVEVFDLEVGSPIRLFNISSRAYVGTGADVMIAGVSTLGAGSLRLLTRAAGPTLQALQISNFLPNPKVELIDGYGVKFLENDDWGSTDSALISQLSGQTGAFAFPVGSKDSACVTTRTQGFTALVSGANGGTGIALVEVYEAN
jgi:Glycoside hydrolase family 44/Immunoglobulin domain